MKTWIGAVLACVAFPIATAAAADTSAPVPAAASQTPPGSATTKPNAGQKQGDVAGSCIPMRKLDGNKTAPSRDAGIATTQGQKRGTARSDCDPGIRADRDATGATTKSGRLLHAFPQGVRLYVSNAGGVARYTAYDTRNQPLKVTAVREPPKGLRPEPGSAIQQGGMRAEENRKRQEAALDDAIRAGGCVIKIGYQGGFLFYDTCANFVYAP